MSSKKHMCVCFVLMTFSILIVSSSAVQNGDVSSVKRDGNFMFDAWIPFYTCITPNLDTCPQIYKHLDPSGIQQLAAIWYALDLIKADETLLPNLTLGVDINEISDVSSAWSRYILEFRDNPGRPIAVINGLTEPHGATKRIHNNFEDMNGVLSQLVQIPQISYASTGIDLSDKTRFQYFSRVVPPDTYQAQAMVDVVKAFNWTYVSTLADSGNYGEEGIATFKHLADKEGICISKYVEIPRDPDNETFVDILDKLLDNSRAKVVVMFVNEDNCQKLVRTSVERGLTNELYWLASDSWGAKEVPVRGQEEAAIGAVTILPQKEVVQGFDTYFMKLNPMDNFRNPWFTEYWEKHFECSIDSDAYPQRCDEARQKITAANYTQEGIVPFVIDAVYAMAHALHNMVIHECGGHYICSAMEPPNGTKLLQYIRNVTFTGVAGQMVKFNENGDPMGRYTIYQFQKDNNGQYRYVKIGNWSDTLSIDMSLTKWKPHEVALPRSVCAEPCPPGERKSNDEQDKCCWVCIPCESHMILRDIHTCEECPNGTYPDETKSVCHALPIEYMTFGSIWAIVPVVVASIGILMTLFIVVVFIKFNSTPVIMASGRELCYVLMVGLLMCYVMTFIMVARPTTSTCCLTRVGLGLSLSICYAALFTKTNRISRIFNRGVKAMVKRPSYTSPKSQLVICLCLVSVQIIGAITWVGMDLPDTTFVYPDRQTVVLRCKSTNVAIVLSLLYNMILIILCTVYAFKTRKIPENFNEAKHIAFTMYSTCIVWLAFIPIYFGTHKSDFRIQITALCMCVSISATVALGCLFVPKVYIVLFQPHKNVRQGAKGSMGSGALGRPLFGRPSTRFSSLAAMNGDITSPSKTPMRLLSNESTCSCRTSTSVSPDSATPAVSPTSNQKKIRFEFNS